MCNANHMIDTPRPITVPEHRIIPVSGIYISTPITTRDGTSSIVIHNHVSEDTAFGLVVNTLQLSDPLQQLFEDDHVSVRLQRGDGTALASIGPPAGAGDTGPQRSASSQRYPVGAVAVASQAWLLHTWLHRVPRFGAVGLLMGLALFAALANRQWRRGAGAEILRAIKAEEFRVFSPAGVGHRDRPLRRREVPAALAAPGAGAWCRPRSSCRWPNAPA